MHFISVTLNSLSLFIIIIGARSSPFSCNPSDLTRNINDDLKALEGTFPETEEQLTLFCKAIENIMTYTNTFMDKCAESNETEIYKYMISGSMEVLSDICTPGSSIRADYLGDTPCFNEVQTEINKCTAIFLTAMTLTDATGNSKICCSWNNLLNCTRTVIINKCNVDAANMENFMLSKSMGPVIQTLCFNYTNDSPDCSSASSSIVPRNSTEE